MSAPAPREIRDAAIWLDAYGTVPSDVYAPYGLDYIHPMYAAAMIDRARKEGWS